MKSDTSFSISQKKYVAVIAMLAWFALLTQFYININSKAASIPEIIIRYFSYFTILTNLLVAVCTTALFFYQKLSWSKFFSHQKTLTAITVYILVVGIIYNVILRFIWNPQGLQMIVDELLHSVIPTLFFLYWLLFVEKRGLLWKNVLPWLLYPLVYIIYVLVRGTLSRFYPYPFINMGQLGLKQTLINAAGVTIVFLFISLLLIAIGKMMSRKPQIEKAL